MRRKKLQELTIKDNFMFGAVMNDEENCRILLEMILGFPIEKITISREKSIVYHPEYKGIRLDIIAKDEKRTHYNVEMQVVKQPMIGKRARYYHSQIDMELLESGSDYEELPDAYVIFICDFDPFDKGLYRYLFHNTCWEDKDVDLRDGCWTIFLSTCGKNEQDISDGLIKFLKYVKAELPESTVDFKNEYVSRLQKSVLRVKTSREMGERYMTLEEWMKDERAEARAEGKAVGIIEGKTAGLVEAILERLAAFCESIPEELEARISGEKDMNQLKLYLNLAYTAKSLQEFSHIIMQMNN